MRLAGRAALGLVLVASVACSASAAPKRVLVVHSFGNVAPPFTTASTAFETALTEEMGERVDLDEVSLDVARYATLDMEEALLELMRKRQTRWQPDLVVPIGSPAGLFVAQNRDRLFPKTTPIIYTGMDKRRLPADALQENATFVGTSYDLPGAVEDILQVAPATTNIVMVIGATPLEQFWVDVLRKEYERFTNRVGFTWFNDLSFDQMLERSANLPPHSFMLLTLLMRDASGVSQNADEALRRLHGVANAPINGLFNNQLGMGIVGGRLYADEEEGVASARIAVRILRGEPATNFPPTVVEVLPPRYDWRELQRWKINEDRLPPGSAVLFREQAVWERYRWHIIAILSVVLIQAILITLLIVNLAKRRHTEMLLRESEERMELATDSAGAGLWSLNLKTRRGWATPRMRELFQFRPDEEVTYESFLRMIHPEDHDRVRHAFDKAAQENAQLNLEFRIVRSDGTQRWIATRGHHSMSQYGETKRWSGASVDITERKQSEAETQELRQELAHVSRVATMGELTASIAHELNQPLTAILSNAQEGRRLATSANPDLNELREIFADIAADDRRASEVIRRLRSLLKKSETERQPLSLNILVTDVLAVVRSEADVKHVAIKLDLDPDLSLVQADRVQLQQVLLNLMVNAFDALTHGIDRPRNVIIRTRPLGNDQVQLDVVDTGSGIDHGKLDSIFQPFVTTKQYGMGMGLTVSRSIVEAHRGRLWAENNSDHGATFHLVLPAIPDPKAGARVA